MNSLWSKLFLLLGFTVLAMMTCCRHFACAAAATIHSNSDGPQLAASPPRGWNSYDSYSWVISEDEFLCNARVVAEKLLPFGYEYVVVDFLWYRKNEAGASVKAAGFDTIDEWGRPIPDPARWPSSANGQGFKWVADQVHAMGLKFGIHVMRGISMQAVKENTPILGMQNHTWRARDIAMQNQPCSWMPMCFVSVNVSTEGGKTFIQSLYNLYASWDVDYVKHDCVFGADDLNIPEIIAVSKAIVATGRPMLYSISPGVHADPSMATLILGLVNTYRVTSDDWDSWNDLQSHFDVARDFANAGLIGTAGLLGFSWPDLDMLPIGYLTDPGANHGPYRISRLTLDEQRTQVTLWAMARSPLMFGGDMITIDNMTLSLLTNPTVLEINANSYGNMELFNLKPDGNIASESIELHGILTSVEVSTKAGRLTKTSGSSNIRQVQPVYGQAADIRVWVAHGQGGIHYVALFNLGTRAITFALPLAGILVANAHGDGASQSYECVGQEVWSRFDLRMSSMDTLSGTVASHGCALYALQCVIL